MISLAPTGDRFEAARVVSSGLTVQPEGIGVGGTCLSYRLPGTEHAVGWRCDSNSPVVVGDPAGLAWKISYSSRIRSAGRVGTSTTLVETD